MGSARQVYPSCVSVGLLAPLKVNLSYSASALFVRLARVAQTCFPEKLTVFLFRELTDKKTGFFLFILVLCSISGTASLSPPQSRRCSFTSAALSHAPHDWIGGWEVSSLLIRTICSCCSAPQPPHSRWAVSWIPTQGLSLWGLHVLAVSASVPSRYSGSLPQSVRRVPQTIW